MATSLTLAQIFRETLPDLRSTRKEWNVAIELIGMKVIHTLDRHFNHRAAGSSGQSEANL